MAKSRFPLFVFACAAAFSPAAFAQSNPAAADVQRDVNQQDRIEQGLQSGHLSTGEAASLERGEAHIDRMESNDLRKGPITSAEQARINQAQNRESALIHADKSHGVVANPDSASSRRMQADVARNAHQESRIEQGIKSGSLNDHQMASLEKGQAHVDHLEARDGAKGHLGRNSQAKIQHAENVQSKHIHSDKTEGR
jgi:hypothetical protein